MTTRRKLIFGAAAGLLATPTLALAQAAPLRLSITPEQISDDLHLPPNVEGNYQIPERYQARVVPVQPGLQPGSLHIVPNSFHLYYVLPENRAIRYGVAIGSEGLGWHGTATIQRKVEWPSWRPTNEMIERNPAAYEKYRDGMPGGPTNPLGARALYFYQNGRDTAIRVHGTVQPSSIGRSVSNGCFRMYNSHVIDLYSRVPVGTTVYVY
ncbi:ErfK/YbiS/YcfS/YnhG family protein [Ketogulonicigenium robustum]|uniref:ErfK/YbiS/YcfS/YnhG family protein n=1 Tax=Ketogulonicigenium robustum TaxID=92947 RepID=A0A1W6P2P0_9RHOB|nr:L,D-transpeptidase [Ketogulonicigenium robustum]ARO15782.1 ErfK/YbiS/YcfS/YnhG family protein [Ketogulonicigenium robustum]